MKLIKIYFGYDLRFESLLLGDRCLSSKFQIVTLLEITKKFSLSSLSSGYKLIKIHRRGIFVQRVEFIPRYENSA